MSTDPAEAADLERALEALDDVESLPLPEQVPVYDAVYQALGAHLAEED